MNYTLTADHLSLYANSLREKELAPATIEKYSRDVNAFLLWLANRPLTKDLAAQWRDYLLDQGSTAATVNAKLAGVNGLFAFLGWENCKVKLLKVQRRAFRDDSRELTQEEYGRLREAAYTMDMEWLALLMETICATGIRVSELKYITVQAVALGRSNVSLKGKIRTIMLPGKLCRKLLKFAKKEKIASGEIFLAKSGESMSRNHIWRAMKSLCQTANVEQSKVFPHNLRHLFATTFYRVTRDIVKLADVLGHSSINTTRIYLISTGAEHSRQLERLGLVS